MKRDKKENRIITFIGPVGVGKSAQMRLLQQYLSERGTRTICTFIKSDHYFTYLLSRILRKLGGHETVIYEDFEAIYPRRDLVRKLFDLWFYMDAFSVALKFFLTVYLPFYLGFTILIEEGLAMTLQSYKVAYPLFLGTSPRTLPLSPRLLEWANRQKHTTIILDATDKTLIHRRNARNYRKKELPEYIRLQRRVMDSLRRMNETVSIDTDRDSILKTHRKIVAMI